MNQRDSLLVLNAIQGIGPVTIRKIVEKYGSPSEIFNRNRQELESDGVLSSQVINNFFHFPKDRFLKDEYNLLAQNDVSVVTYLDAAYPQALLSTYDYPVVLYVKGEIPSNQSKMLAVIGSRLASIYGLTIAEQYACRLAELGFVIVSGLARGIDTNAHRGAIKGRGQTIAVLGSGLANIYPPENHALAYEIASHGALVSEFPMTTPPIAIHFPRRNRIISGLSKGVLVVEAAKKSGALITAELAMEQNREVFAIPGPINVMSSQGVNSLIKDGAKIVTTVEDIIEEFNGIGSIDTPRSKHSIQADEPLLPPKLNKSDFNEVEVRLIELLEERPRHIDELLAVSGLSLGTVMSTLLRLELKKVVEQLPGKIFSVQVSKQFAGVSS